MHLLGLRGFAGWKLREALRAFSGTGRAQSRHVSLSVGLSARLGPADSKPSFELSPIYTVLRAQAR
jgi:hypothetical protein